ncbi:MAG: NUDIX domain-containing protein [Planctomycetota bacterium]
MPAGTIEIIARGLLRAGDHILVCRNLKHGYAYLPGGHVEFGEAASDALQRELVEELGASTAATMSVGPLLLVNEGSFGVKKREHHELNLVFHVEHAFPSVPPPVASTEQKIAFDWLDMAALPEADLRPGPVRAWLAAGGVVEGPPIGWLSDMQRGAGRSGD